VTADSCAGSLPEPLSGDGSAGDSSGGGGGTSGGLSGAGPVMPSGGGADVSGDQLTPQVRQTMSSPSWFPHWGHCVSGGGAAGMGSSEVAKGVSV